MCPPDDVLQMRSLFYWLKQRLIGRSLTVTLDHNMESFLKKKKKLLAALGLSFSMWNLLNVACRT